MEKNLAIDIGGTSIKIAVIEKDKILEKTSMRNIFKGKQDQLVEGIKSICDEYINKYKINKIGIGCPGEIVDNVVLDATNLGWHDFNIVESFKKEYPDFSIKVENDGDTSCLAEKTYGHLKNHDNGIFVVIGRGIGGAIIYDGKVVKGVHDLGGRIGHMVIKINGRKCNCGRRGCFETYGSVYGLIRTVKETNNKWENEKEKVDDSTLSGFAIAKYKIAKQPMILASINKYLDDLADGLLNLCFLFDPEIIVLAGGITEGNIIDINYLQEKLNNCGYDKCQVKLSSFKGKAGLIGASIIAK